MDTDFTDEERASALRMLEQGLLTLAARLVRLENAVKALQPPAPEPPPAP